MTEPTTMTDLIDVPLDSGPVAIRGAIEIERTETGLLPRRLPAWARGQIPDDFMRQTMGESAGIRLAFRSAATVIELEVNAVRMMPDATAPVPAASYDLVVDGETVVQRSVPAGGRFVFTLNPRGGERIPGPSSRIRFDGLPTGEKELELWLPFTDEVELIALSADADVLPPSAPVGITWVHHGSSISHGYSADAVTGTWPVVAAREAGIELTSLAFAGNAMLDAFTARSIRDTDADFISIKIGINLVNGDIMRLRAFRPAVHGFIDTIRDGHPETPLLVISPIYCEPVEHLPGPTMQDPNRTEPWSITAGREEELATGKLSLGVIRRELAAIVESRRANDPNLHYLDGLSLYGPEDAERMPLPDNLHPGPDVQRLMGERFARDILPRFTS